MYLVTGATGNVGSEVVGGLTAAGYPVRALIRQNATARLPDGVETAAGDLNVPDSVKRALTGVQGAFLLPGYADMSGLVNVIREGGVKRVVLLSGSSAASGDLTNAITAYMVASEQAVRASGLAWTILRPSAFMSNTFQWIPQIAAGDVIRAPFASVGVAMIDPADIGTAAALALTTRGHEGQIYRITGPETLLPADRVRILSRVLGRDLRFEPQSDDEAYAEMTATMPRQYVDAFLNFYVDGALDESPVLPTFQQITGHPPHTFRQWVQAHAAAFTRERAK